MGRGWGLKATKDTADHSEIVSFVALSRGGTSGKVRRGKFKRCDAGMNHDRNITQTVSVGNGKQIRIQVPPREMA